MNKSFNASEISFVLQGKNTNFEQQQSRVFASFKEQPKTMLMASFDTGILRANICRYIAEWERQGVIRLIEKRLCEISKHRAGYYTTNSELFPSIVELSNTTKP